MAARKESTTVDLKVRMKEPLRAALERAAEKRGVSMNAEAVSRLEKSFDREDLLPQALELAYGPEIAGLLMMIGAVAADISPVTALANLGRPARVVDNATAYDQFVRAVNRLLEQLKPADQTTQYPLRTNNPELANEILGSLLDVIGQAAADTALQEAITGETAGTHSKSMVANVHRLVGDLARERLGETFIPERTLASAWVGSDRHEAARNQKGDDNG